MEGGKQSEERCVHCSSCWRVSGSRRADGLRVFKGNKQERYHQRRAMRHREWRRAESSRLEPEPAFGAGKRRR